MKILAGGRIWIGAMGWGWRGRLGKGLRFARDRQAFGKPISEFQAIQCKLANMATGSRPGER